MDKNKKRAFQILWLPQIVLWTITVESFLVAGFLIAQMNVSVGAEYPDYVSGYVIVGSVLGGMLVGVVAAAIMGAGIILAVSAILHTVLMHVAKKAYYSEKRKKAKICLLLCQIIGIFFGVILLAGTIQNWHFSILRISFVLWGLLLVFPSVLSIYVLHNAGEPCEPNSENGWDKR